ncbi:MAG TPA: membrane protein insertion efficiency factor YidD [Rhizomicrobium sp.]|jgi:putative membrane protein insertion efficiency factor|nr:membrane protein insertion efficiency factor YidD [Rhizomicrobium sp.]
MRKLMVALLSAPIRAYRAVISPLSPHVCRFSPSCSAYALEALHTLGPAKGLWLTARRLSRCHPIGWLGGSSGFDPVPQRQIQRFP